MTNQKEKFSKLISIECKEGLSGNDLYNMLVFAFKNFNSFINVINSINVFPTPDGDTGLNMNETLKEIIAELNNTPFNNHCGEIIGAVAKGAFNGSSGNSGIILAEYFHGLEAEWKEKRFITGKDLAKGLLTGAKFAYEAIEEPREGTILTVTKKTAEKAMEIAKTINNPCLVLIEAFKTAKEALYETHLQLLEANKAGVVDAGALGFVIILEGFVKSIFSDSIFTEEITTVLNDESISGLLKPNLEKLDDKLEPEWEIQFYINGLKVPKEEFRVNLKKFGNFILVLQESKKNRFKIHIHTKYDFETIIQDVKEFFDSYELISILALHEQYQEYLNKHKES